MSDPMRRSGEWCQLFDVQVLDPDGWDRSDFQRSWNEQITLTEFKRRLMVSTAYVPPNVFGGDSGE
jgi:hypothetical protein